MPEIGLERRDVLAEEKSLDRIPSRNQRCGTNDLGLPIPYGQLQPDQID